MASFNVVVKHRGKDYEIEVDESSTGEIFKSQLYSLTGVEPHRQKVIYGGKQLKDDTEMSKLGLKPRQQMMMLGTPEGASFVRPAGKIRFVEDMSQDEAAQQQGVAPAGLVNLGNTCYLNSTLQTLRSIPELQDALSKYQYQRNPGGLPGAAQDVTSQLKILYQLMSQTTQGMAPYTFLYAIRETFPQFAELSRVGGGFAQQDAEEAWSQIMSQLKQKLVIKSGEDSEEGEEAKGISFVERYMAGEFSSTLECDDPAAAEAGEKPASSKEQFLKLNCHISSQINHLRDGIASGLTEKVEKRSEVLGRDVSYTKKSQISRLPKYLTVHFVRFFWKRDAQKKAKILRKVTFPHELDVVEFCTDELRKALVPVRDKVREIRKDEEDIDRARKRRKKNPGHDSDEDPAGDQSLFVKTNKHRKIDDNKKTNTGSSSAARGQGSAATAQETFKTDAEFEAEKDAALLAVKKELYELINPDLLKDDGANQSGLYELRGVVTHQGASADSGHYTAYVKKTGAKDPKTGKVEPEDGKWWWFNDEKVTEVPAEKIDGLSGGGESHSALILLYRAIPLPSAEGIMQ
ncbi:putative ubiquitin carboxyl-terminal hydrolase [Diplogelasinospora grovesii]|uniref:Ubiquitin carboxyl-terminal hydrolase n=1 Tax=Diplogelasinospora grovesii TaxID=303347 RepID=A0AAN6NDV9_9PEZI|nr:putative ubiquitin carboxyl-terminal hydrolase [Diplogelasinospora grovesii]